jgi:CRISPR-associated protein Csm4
MQSFKLTLQPRSAFGTPLAGDTLFGQLCWAVRLRRGEAGLTELLRGYAEGQPFAIISDAFPSGTLPRPAIPEARLSRKLDPRRRKEEKRRVWLPAAKADLPLADWLDLAQEQASKSSSTAVLTQNTINRLTGTTGEGIFAPRQVEQIVFAEGATLDVYVLVDEARLEAAALREALEDIGAGGFGRDASTGLGKFDVTSFEPHHWPAVAGTQAFTLAPCAPQPESLDARACFYHPLTRFGRHGNIAVHSGEAGPFKRPILMLRTGAFLTFRSAGVPSFHGTGLGGVAQPISGVIPATVHQGYAPLVPIDAALSTEAA